MRQRSRPPVVGFDLDLTLVDSRPGILAAYGALAEELGLVLDLAAVDARLGITLEDELAHWVEPADVDTAATCFRRHYAHLAPMGTTLLPGAAEAFEAVRRRGGTVLVVTAKSAQGTAICLEHVGLAPDIVETHVHGLDKAVVLRRHQATAYVGDSLPDMHAATAAGCVGIGVTTGNHGEAELRAAGAAHVLGSLVELGPLLG